MTILRHIALLLLLASTCCTPRDQTMLVSDVRGNFYYGFSSGAWDLDEIKECEIASRTSLPPDDKTDLLLCGMDTRQAWKLSWIRRDLRTVVYVHVRILPSPFTVRVKKEARERRYGSARKYRKASIVSDRNYLATTNSKRMGNCLKQAYTFGTCPRPVALLGLGSATP